MAGVIDHGKENGSVKIRTNDEDETPLLVNGYRLNLYQTPLIK